ncbi:MAG TPA: YceI family protein [Terracidiphilus sp.]|nr:YceI family protein [Terracidiphilus sp.]
MSAATAGTSTVTTWKIDPAHSVAEFKVKHMMIANVKGKFSGITGTMTLDEADPTRSTIEASIPMETVFTGDAQRDAHLKSPDFFHAEKHPLMTFKSTRIQAKEPGEMTVTGDLTIHGVTKAVTFDVEGPTPPGKDPWGNTRVGVEATTRINRKDFGLGWNAALETGGVLVGEDVAITLDVEFIKG